MTERVTAKVKVTGHSAANGQTQLRIEPDYADDRNKAWAVATPALQLSMTVKDEVAAFFEPGAAYTLTFERAED